MRKLILIIALLIFSGDLFPQDTQGSITNIPHTFARRDAYGGFSMGKLIVTGISTGVDLQGAYTNAAIDLTDVTNNYGGSSGPVLLRGGTYGSPMTSADAGQSGGIRLYTMSTATTDDESTGYYDRGIFIYNRTDGSKNIYPIAGLAEVRTVSGDGPKDVIAGQFIAGLRTAGAKLDDGNWGMFGTWNKIYSETGSVAVSGTKVAPLWIDNQMSGTVSGEEYGIFLTTGASVPDAVMGFETSSSGWDQLFYFDETTYNVAPVSNLSLKVLLNTTQKYIPLSSTAPDYTFSDDLILAGEDIQYTGDLDLNFARGSTTGQNPYLSVYGYSTTHAGVKYGRINVSAQGNMVIWGETAGYLGAQGQSTYLFDDMGGAFIDDKILRFGSDNDASILYDETTMDTWLFGMPVTSKRGLAFIDDADIAVDISSLIGTTNFPDVHYIDTDSDSKIKVGWIADDEPEITANRTLDIQSSGDVDLNIFGKSGAGENALFRVYGDESGTPTYFQIAVEASGNTDINGEGNIEFGGQLTQIGQWSNKWQQMLNQRGVAFGTDSQGDARLMWDESTHASGSNDAFFLGVLDSSRGFVIGPHDISIGNGGNPYDITALLAAPLDAFPKLTMLDADRDSYFKFGWSADDTPFWTVGGVATGIGLTANLTLTGDFLAGANTYDVGSAGTRFNLAYFDTVYANVYTNSDFVLGESGFDVTVNADTIKGAPVWEGNFVVTGTVDGVDIAGNVPLLNGRNIFTDLNTFQDTTIFDDKVGIGTASPAEKLHVNTVGNTTILLERTDVAVGVDNIIGRIQVKGGETTQDIVGAIEIRSSEAWTASDSRTYMAFLVTPNDSLDAEEQMRLDSEGKLVVVGDQTLYGVAKAHASANTLTIVQTSQNYGVVGELSDNSSSGFSFVAGQEGVIATIATIAAGDSINITDVAHGLSDGDYIAVQSANHTGLVEVNEVDNDNFRVDINFVGDEVGTWQEGDYLLASAGTAGNYKAELGATTSAGAAPKEYHFHLVQNITEIGTSFVINIRGTQHQSGYDADRVTVTAGDKFWVVIENETDAQDLLYEDMTVFLHKL